MSTRSCVGAIVAFQQVCAHSPGFLQALPLLETRPAASLDLHSLQSVWTVEMEMSQQGKWQQSISDAGLLSESSLICPLGYASAPPWVEHALLVCYHSILSGLRMPSKIYQSQKYFKYSCCKPTNHLFPFFSKAVGVVGTNIIARALKLVGASIMHWGCGANVS